MTFRGRRVVLVASALMTFVSRGEATIVQADPTPTTDVTRAVRLPPGKGFVMNFLATAGKTTLTFTPHTGVLFEALVHDKSDVFAADRSVSVHCPGVSTGHVKVLASDETGIAASSDLTPKAIGHYGYAWQNNTKQPVDIYVQLYSNSPIIMTTVIGNEFVRSSTPKDAAEVSVEALSVLKCGPPPPSGAGWFYLGAPGEHPARAAARRARRALNAAFGEEPRRDPKCLRVAVVDDERDLAARYKKLSRGGPKQAIVGFHSPKLGADSTIFVAPHPGQGLDVVIVHEALHALSHRFSNEAGQRRVQNLIEGATEYITRELADASLGIPKKAFHTGYGPYVSFYDALMRRLGTDGLALLTKSYLDAGYDFFEREVNRQLDIELRLAGHALQQDDLSEALQRISAP